MHARTHAGKQARSRVPENFRMPSFLSLRRGTRARTRDNGAGSGVKGDSEVAEPQKLRYEHHDDDVVDVVDNDDDDDNVVQA